MLSNISTQVATLSVVFALLSAGCSASDDIEHADFTPVLADVESQEPEQLAARYIMEPIGPDGGDELLASIRSLDAEGLKEFGWWVLEYQRIHFDEPAERDEMLFSAMVEYGAQTGTPFFDIDESEVSTALSPVFDIGVTEAPEPFCVPGWASCTFTAAWNGTVTALNYTPVNGGLAGNASDRMSNSACEELGCDFRLFYNVGNTGRTKFFGTTAAALCVQNKYPSLLTYKSGNTQYTLVGYVKTFLLCGVNSGMVLRQTLLLN